MSATLRIHRAGPSVTLQDEGRRGYLDVGLSRGGAADTLALAEGAALLGQSPALPVIEMAGMGGEFEASEDIRIALTGAPMRTTLDGSSLAWHAAHLLPAGSRLSIGPVEKGCYGYLHVGGGLATQPCLGAQSAHLAAGIGRALQAGDTLKVGKDGGRETNLLLEPENRFEGGTIRIVASFQTHLFSPAELDRLQSVPLRRGRRANRMGVALEPEGGGFHIEGGRNVVSEIIVPGDIQITGDGTPFVLMAECQTTGGYPRIGTILPCDLTRMAQAPAEAELRLCWVDLANAIALEREEAHRRADLHRQCGPLIRDPRRMHDLLSYQLISGVVAGDEED
ncbi:biotin-dependent carboxyltransferase family protein [Amaricoccus macauensis]|uniref:5-oxoprolinase subunit C family protein n=1 Tax=Amaricoccus macauensis TaxID=57001 RepID=UPI003C7B1540